MRKFFSPIGRVVLNVLKIFITFIFLPTVLVGGIVVTILIIKELSICSKDEYANLIIGLATSLFSTVIAASSVISLFTSKTKTNNSQIEQSISFINSFNDDYLDDLIFVRQVIRSANSQKSYNITTKAIIDIEKSPANDLPKGITYADYKAEVIKFSFLDLYTKPNALSANLINYMLGVTNYNANTLGIRAVYSIFKKKRIRILNYFESMAIGLGNKIYSLSLLKNQFYDLLNETIPILLIFIYNEEGEKCYPALRAMLMEWYL